MKRRTIYNEDKISLTSPIPSSTSSDSNLTYQSTSTSTKESRSIAPSTTTDNYDNNDKISIEKIKLQNTEIRKDSNIPANIGCSLCRARWERNNLFDSSSSLSSSSTTSKLQPNDMDDHDNSLSISSNTNGLPCNTRACSRPTSTSSLNKYTKCDVLLHQSIHDCWIIAHNKIYDVTSFIMEHPGGVQSILKHAGTDSTIDFDFHSNSARKLWNKYEIGVLIPCEGESSGGCNIM